MATQFDFDMAVTQDVAGKDFDKWFDWNSAATNAPDPAVSATHGTRTLNHFPISPSSTAASEGPFSTIKPQSLTAPFALDIPTPSHSSSPPETRSSIELRLSGDTLREYPILNTRSVKKRKHSSEDEPTTPLQHNESNPAAKKRPHNIIEKRYRANLNEKIAELRDSVPSLRNTKKTNERSSDEEELDGLTSSTKLNKASILTKAVEYIRHLEFRNKRLEDENRSLKERLETLDKVIARGGHDSQRAAAFTSTTVIENELQNDFPGSGTSLKEQSNQSSHPPQGLIPLPESWRLFRQQNQSQEHYGHLFDTPSEKTILKGRWPTRILVGSLAGLMVMGLSESDQGTESREKGLFGIPLELLDGWKFLQSPRLYLAAFAQFCRAGGVIPLMKGFTALTILAFLVFAYLFNSKPTPKQDLEEDAMRSPQLPAPASPIEVRRRAWSTSMQTLKLPHHSFFPEWLAVTSEWLKYTVRHLFGSAAYAWLTGRSIDDENSRIKAWDIAIDAQLAGGDVEISRSRVVLTSFGSGTLPKTPLRLMLKALHCRVLLWNVGCTGSFPCRLANKVAKFFANREWQRAQQLHERIDPRDTERLPPYLSALLTMGCDEVMLDNIVQRAYNLMYDRPTQEGSEDALMDVVVEDHAVRSPLDAVAAWRSTYALRNCLEDSFRCSKGIDVMQEPLELSLKIAPPGSAAETRSLAAHAVFDSVNRGAFYNRGKEALQHSINTETAQSGDSDSRVPFFVDTSIPASARADIETCLKCAQTLLLLDNKANVESATELYSSASPEQNSNGILALAAMNRTIARLPTMESRARSQSENRPQGPLLESNEVGKTLSPITVQADNTYMQQPMWEHKRRQSSVSNDTGYESQ